MLAIEELMDLYAEIKANHAGLRERIVFMTGGTFTEGARSFLDSVPNERIDKPFTVQSLVDVVTRAAG